MKKRPVAARRPGVSVSSSELPGELPTACAATGRAAVSRAFGLQTSRFCYYFGAGRTICVVLIQQGVTEMKLTYRVATAALLSLGALAAHAEITGTVSAVSDYNFRGISLSSSDPALQGSLDWAGESGFYARRLGQHHRLRPRLRRQRRSRPLRRLRGRVFRGLRLRRRPGRIHVPRLERRPLRPDVGDQELPRDLCGRDLQGVRAQAVVHERLQWL